MVQGYHELYELQRSRLEAQLLQTSAERDSWSQLTYSLALKVPDKISCLFYHIILNIFIVLVTLFLDVTRCLNKYYLPERYNQSW